MTISFGALIERDLHPTAQSYQVGNRLFLVNDGPAVIHEAPSFTVWDDRGNRILVERPVTDATEEDLAGYEFMGVTLRYSATVRHIEARDDGGFVIHYAEHNPRLQFGSPSQPPSSTKMRAFAADGTPEPSQPGIVKVDVDGAYETLNLEGGGFAEVWAADGTRPDELTIHGGAGGSVRATFEATGEPVNTFLPAAPASFSLAQSGNTIFVVHQDAQTGNVYLNRYGLDAVKIGSEIALDVTDNAAIAGRPAADLTHAATLEDGRVVVTWSNPGPAEADGIDLFQMILNADGSVARPAERINTDLTVGTQYDAQVHPLADGSYVIVYHTISTVIDANYRQEAVARLYNADGTPATDTIAFPEADVNLDALNAHMAAVFPSGFGYMLDGFGNEYTIQVGEGSGETDPSDLFGTEGDDVLPGSEASERIFALAGDDIILPSGDDPFTPAGGPDTIDGGAGSDTVSFVTQPNVEGQPDGETLVRLDLAAGTAEIVGATTHTLRDIENANGSHSNDVLSGDAQANRLIGLGGADRLIGLDGDDTLEGGTGPDTLNGGNGNDIIIGGLDGHEQDQRNVIYAGAGDDRAEGGGGNDQIFGQEGNDTLSGGFGADELQGQEGNDVVTGGALSDLVYGGAGDDFVNGGFGHDRINGGAGADRFFHLGVADHGSDWVQDFVAAEGDLLVFGGTARRDQFQVNFDHTATSDGDRSGDDSVQEAFVIYRPTGQILWALVDGEGQDAINMQIGSEIFDLMA
ncbi:calcium-binding protein [Lutimaribacter marinistellae]|uniref:Calcium-binding protein n=1 Tax=Lutimaribacter marinistellae TaxID=1820329 RepID=A0ABV7TE42_9RHOB